MTARSTLMWARSTVDRDTGDWRPVSLCAWWAAKAPEIDERGARRRALGRAPSRQIGTRPAIRGCLHRPPYRNRTRRGGLSACHPLANWQANWRLPRPRWRKRWRWSRALDPTGIGARSLAECLALQAREADRYDPCMAKLLDNLELLARGELARLKRMCGVDDEDFAEMLAELRGYDPKPGCGLHWRR
jgi:RNA polymerase sigma-54 factor